MKAQELRIGNFVKYRNDIAKIDLEDFKLMCEFPTSHSSWKPIPLTEDWLLRFGFEVEVKTAYSTGLPVDFNIYKKGSFKFNEIQGNWWVYGVLVKKQPLYVHKLQNLYFALTGEELTIK